MAKEKRSFFERLTGTVSLDEYNDSFEEEEAVSPAKVRNGDMKEGEIQNEMEEEEGQY